MSAAVDTALLIAMLVLTVLGVIGTWANVVKGGWPCGERRTVRTTDLEVEYDGATPVLALKV